MNLPSLNLRRTLLIARRDYVGYIKTWGFWISFFLPFILMSIGVVISTMDLDFKPTRYETILDSTGRYGAPMIAQEEARQKDIERKALSAITKAILSDADAETLIKIYDTDGVKAARDYVDTKVPGLGKRLKIPTRNLIFIDPPANSIEAIQPYLKGEKQAQHEGQNVSLSGMLYLSEEEGQLSAQYWSENVNSIAMQNMAQRFFREKSTAEYLEQGDLTLEGLADARKGALALQSFDPSKSSESGTEGQAVTDRDIIPYFVAMGLSIVLWFTVFSGSYMLLTSLLEEKLNKLLEMMLASTRLSEIMFGKLIGVAALTITAMLPYLILGAGGLVAAVIFGDPEVAAGIRAALDAQMIIFFFIFLILGYVFYGAFFIALGALAESMQDAQTLTTPIMLILTLSVLIVPVGVETPDSPLLLFASWFPLSAPFASLMRLPSDPPLWELCLSAFILFVCACAVVWLAGRIFRYGVLSGSGVKGALGWVIRKVLRRSV